MNLDFKFLLLCAELSDAVYERDVTKLSAQVETLGCRFVGLITNGSGGDDQGDCQILVVTLPDARTGLIVRGTEVTGPGGPSLHELFDDVFETPLHLGVNLSAPDGVIEPLMRCMPQLYRITKPGHYVVMGHSLGGGRCEELPPLIYALDPNPEGVSFGAIRSGNQEFCNYAWPDATRLTRVVAEDDFAPDHGLGWEHRQNTMLWIHNGMAIQAVSRGPINTSLRQHDIRDSYCVKLKALTNVVSGSKV